jgi:hypothetical protein
MFDFHLNVQVYRVTRTFVRQFGLITKWTLVSLPHRVDRLCDDGIRYLISADAPCIQIVSERDLSIACQSPLAGIWARYHAFIWINFLRATLICKLIFKDVGWTNLCWTCVHLNNVLLLHESDMIQLIKNTDNKNVRYISVPFIRVQHEKTFCLFDRSPCYLYPGVLNNTESG